MIRARVAAARAAEGRWLWLSGRGRLRHARRGAFLPSLVGHGWVDRAVRAEDDPARRDRFSDGLVRDAAMARVAANREAHRLASTPAGGYRLLATSFGALSLGILSGRRFR